MKAKVLIPFSVPTENGIYSPRKGEIIEVSEEMAEAYIAEGILEEYTLVDPTGKLTITGTAEVDCAAYATAQVVDENLVAGNIKKGVTILGVEGTYEA